MDAALRKRRTLKGKITRLQSAIEGEDSFATVLVIRYKQQLDQLWVDLNEVHDELSEQCDDQSFEIHQTEYNVLANRIESLQIKLPEQRDEIDGTGSGIQSPRTVGSMDVNVRLPRLELPKFSGNFHEWSSFHDLFVSTIVNNDRLSGAQKLQYLKASLQGEASALLQSIQVTDDNFIEAWDILRKRYHNKREIINAHLRRLCTQPAINNESPISLRKLIDTTNETVRALRVLGVPIEHWDAILVHLIADRLDVDSRRQWELSSSNNEMPKYTEFIAFLELRARALTTCLPSRLNKSSVRPDRRQAGVSSYHAEVTKESCRICKERHLEYRCNKFLAGSVEERRALVKTHGLCYNCLASNHQSKSCKAGSCKKCGSKHHTLLHFSNVKSEGPISEQGDLSVHHGLNSYPWRGKGQVLLATAIVKIKDAHGNMQLCRVLMDSGSQASFVSEACVQRLGLQRRSSNMIVTGVNNTTIDVVRGSVTLIVRSCSKDDFSLTINALIMRKVTGNLPKIQCNPIGWRHIEGLELADPRFHEPGPIEALFGADALAEILQSGFRRGAKGTPIAQASSLGWLLSGLIEGPPSVTKVIANTALTELQGTIEKFWKMEETPVSTSLSVEQLQCEEHFVETHQRDPSGRFIVRLPFNSKPIVFDSVESRRIALRRLFQVRERLRSRPLDLVEYNTFLKEYEDLGHMVKLSDEEVSRRSAIFLPHHSVIKESSTTTRLRVVFDASTKMRNGTSLNDHLLVGATLQDDVFSIMIRFRTHLIAFTADIAKMYRQIRVHEADTRFQTIVWNRGTDEVVENFSLVTLTYGTASAPFLATRCLQQLIQDEGEKYPEAAAVAARDFYIDDLMSGADSVEKALELKGQLIALLARGGFQLRKWSSSSEDVTRSLSLKEKDSMPEIIVVDHNVIKTLGVRWHANTDHFSFSFSPPQVNTVCTKRTILSTIAKIYDPLGWLTPITVKAKMFIQQLWKINNSWDEPAPPDLEENWKRFLGELCKIETLIIPRALSKNLSTGQELIGFCDASEKAYAAVVYLRTENTKGDREITLIAAKSKLAPVKPISLPRLELCGAVLLAKLMVAIQRAFLKPIPIIQAWTDSTIVLAWIQADGSKWKTFVGNRVTMIQDRIPSEHWHHVSGMENPADCASRGINPSHLNDHQLWWKGPEWLLTERKGLTLATETKYCEQVRLEERVTLVNTSHEPHPFLKLFSSLSLLTRVTAYLFRFIDNCRTNHQTRQIGPLTNQEINKATFFWIRNAQEVFSPEHQCLSRGIPIARGSRLLSLNPFLDHLGLIRVGGRLHHAPIHSDQKFPIVLPKKHILTALIGRSEHQRLLHAGPQQLLASLRLRFWIICGRDVARQIVKQCVVCQRQNAKCQRPYMGNLPSARLTVSSPFLHTGVDYTGPFLLRALKIRGQRFFKAYVALFVCYVTHAIHLELVSDMTTDALLAAIKRFIARRGICNHFYSDNGSNFIGADRQWKEFHKMTQTQVSKDSVNTFCQSTGSQWHFNPPSAPHFGGLWEAGVKSTKYHLKRIVGNVPLNFEEFSTLLSQVESCLNSRPLCPMSDDPNDLSALTPGHFLIGRPLTSLPEPDLSEMKLNRLSRWQLVQRLQQHFWKRWSREYLPLQQPRPKKWTRHSDITINDLVLLKDETQPPLRWRLGRVLQTHPGTDGIVRVVTVKTERGNLQRPVVKLCKISVEQNLSS